MKFGKLEELSELYHMALTVSKYSTPVKSYSRSNLKNTNIFDLDLELWTGVSQFDAVCCKQESTSSYVSMPNFIRIFVW